MRIKNIMLLLILLTFPMSLSIDNVSANETSEVEDIKLEALNGDSELKDGFEEEVEKALEYFSNIDDDHSRLMTAINENLSEDEFIKNELGSMHQIIRENLYNKLKEKEDLSELSNEEKTILEILEESYIFPSWKIPIYAVLSVIAFLALIIIIVKLFS